MERRAEEEAGDASLAAMRPETAVARGSLLRGLVCTDAAGGLYGARITSLTFPPSSIAATWRPRACALSHFSPSPCARHQARWS